MHKHTHKTLWVVYNIRTGHVTNFSSEENARSYCLVYGDSTPLTLLSPLYL